MQSIIDFINVNIPLQNPLIASIALGFCFLIVYDFYHTFFSAILSWFKKK